MLGLQFVLSQIEEMVEKAPNFATKRFGSVPAAHQKGERRNQAHRAHGDEAGPPRLDILAAAGRI